MSPLVIAKTKLRQQIKRASALQKLHFIFLSTYRQQSARPDIATHYCMRHCNALLYTGWPLTLLLKHIFSSNLKQCVLVDEATFNKLWKIQNLTKAKWVGGSPAKRRIFPFVGYIILKVQVLRETNLDQNAVYHS